MTKYTFNVLLSCMWQTDTSIIEKSNLTSCSTIVINQCKCDQESIHNINMATIINTPTRGLSNSRNIGIKNSTADICLIADDDEIFSDDLQLLITSAYEKIPNADVIIFRLSNCPCKLGNRLKKLKRLDCLKVSSCQISFKLSSIKEKVYFDPNLGAGTGNGASEENKFLLDCYNKRLNIYYVPIEIGKMKDNSGSTWFHGFDENYFFNRGKTTRYILGKKLAVFYAWYYLIFKYKLYKERISFYKAKKFLFMGLKEKNINAKLETTR